jgi:phenylacetate-CoA ligase
LKLVYEKSIKYGRLEKSNSYNSLQEILSAIPITTKDDLVQYGLEHEDLYQNKGILFSETSGTTGVPLLTPRSEVDLKWNTNNQMLAYKRHIQPSVDRVAIIHPGVLSPFVEASSMALNALGVGFVRIYPVPKVCDYARMLSVLRRNKITAIMTTPSLAYKFLYEVSLLDPDFSDFPVCKFLLTGEYISNSNAGNIKRIVGSHAYTVPFVYGSSEAATLMYGIEDCTYRAIKEDFVFEIVDPDTNRWIDKSSDQDSYSGKLVVTWLRDGLMPILRYDTNDIFSVKEIDGDYSWEMVGRNSQSSRGMPDQRLIDRIIYECGVPVFHFSCRIKSKMIEVDIIASKKYSDRSVTEKIADGINRSLDENVELVININPEDHAFYDFSLSPKLSKFNYS